jgi:hypothetical protein
MREWKLVKRLVNCESRCFPREEFFSELLE